VGISEHKRNSIKIFSKNSKLRSLSVIMRSSVMTQMKYVRWLITLRLFLWYFDIIKWQTWEDYAGENSSSYINILYKPHWWCNGRLCVRTPFRSNQRPWNLYLLLLQSRRSIKEAEQKICWLKIRIICPSRVTDCCFRELAQYKSNY